MKFTGLSRWGLKIVRSPRLSAPPLSRGAGGGSSTKIIFYLITTRHLPSLLLAIALGGINAVPIQAESVTASLRVPMELTQAPPSFNETQILALMAQISQAEAAEDVDTLMSFLAPFVVSEITVESGDQRTTRMVEGLSAHRDILKKSYDRSVSKEILNEKMSVRFDDDGNIAVVTRYTIETTDLTDDRRFISMAKDVIRFALVDGQPKVISVVTDGWSEPRP